MDFRALSLWAAIGNPAGGMPIEWWSGYTVVDAFEARIDGQKQTF